MEKEKRDWIIGFGVIVFLMIVLVWFFLDRNLRLEDTALLSVIFVLFAYLLFAFYKHKNENKKFWKTYLVIISALGILFGILLALLILGVATAGYSLDSVIVPGIMFILFAAFVWAYWKKKKAAFYVSLAIAYFALLWFLYFFYNSVILNPWIAVQPWQIESTITYLSMVLFLAFFAFKSKSEFGIKKIIPKKLGKVKFYLAVLLFTIVCIFWFLLPIISQDLALQGNPILCGITSSSESCFRNAAVAGQMPELCPDDWCLAEYASYNKDLSICENSEFENERIRDSCFSMYGTRHHSTEACDKMRDLKDTYQKNRCYTHIAIALRDFEICNKINDSATQNECVDEIHSYSGNCEEIINQEIKDSCYYNKSKSRNDESLCEKITDEQMRKNCIEPPGLI